MEQWVRMSRRFNVGLGIAALLLFTSAPLAFVSSVMAQGGEQAVVPADTGHAQPTAEALMTPDGHAKVRCWAFVAAALATGLGSMAAGYAVGHVGTAAMGAVSEKPELMGKSLIYVALAEGIAIYGLLISIIVLAKV